MDTSIGIIGFGNMGEALAEGLRRKNPGIRIGVMEKDDARCERASELFGAEILTGSAEAFFAFSDLSVIAVKPQDFTALLKNLSPFVREDSRIISIAAGVTIEHIRVHLKTGLVCRIMPNLAAVLGKAFTGVSFAPGVPEAFRSVCLETVSALGTALELPERLMPAVTGLSGSGIGYVFSFLHALALGGTKSGIPYDTSLKIAVSILEGAAAMVSETGEHPISLLSKVISPAGTTIEGLAALEDGAFTASVLHAVEKASARARELET